MCACVCVVDLAFFRTAQFNGVMEFGVGSCVIYNDGGWVIIATNLLHSTSQYTIVLRVVTSATSGNPPRVRITPQRRARSTRGAKNAAGAAVAGDSHVGAGVTLMAPCPAPAPARVCSS